MAMKWFSRAKRRKTWVGLFFLNVWCISDETYIVSMAFAESIVATLYVWCQIYTLNSTVFLQRGETLFSARSMDVGVVVMLGVSVGYTVITNFGTLMSIRSGFHGLVLPTSVAQLVKLASTLTMIVWHLEHREFMKKVIPNSITYTYIYFQICGAYASLLAILRWNAHRLFHGPAFEKIFRSSWTPGRCFCTNICPNRGPGPWRRSESSATWLT